MSDAFKDVELCCNDNGYYVGCTHVATLQSRLAEVEGERQKLLEDFCDSKMEVAYNNELWSHLELLNTIHVTEGLAWLLNFSDGTNGHATTFQVAVAEALQRTKIMKSNPEFAAAIRAGKESNNG